MKGQRVVEVDAQLIVELLKGCAPGRGLEVTKDALPDDATAQFVYYDADRGMARIYCTSDAWQARETEFKTVTAPTLMLRYGSNTWNYPLSMWADRVRGLFAVLRGSEAPIPPLVFHWGGILDRLWSAREGQEFPCPLGEKCTLQAGRVGVDHAVFHCSPTQPAASFVIDEGSNLTATPETLLTFVRKCHTSPKAIDWDTIWKRVCGNEAHSWSCPLGGECELRIIGSGIVHIHPDNADQSLPIPGNDAVTFEFFIRRCHRDTTLPY